MNFLLLVFAAFGFLAQVTPVSGGWPKCGVNTPGYCRLFCHSRERSTFLCDRNRRCCVTRTFLPGPIGFS
ncbi:beta-defensin 132 [Cynocephalus volans]|uniref:beta-defensin 132 n=1 Tax=Cynocephalus volans TaxID=110931 RepID=UPI002FC69A3C